MEDTDNRALWDRKYEEGLPSLTKPDPFFVSAYERLVDRSFPNAGMALDLAAGLGRHALWLADRGWQVSAVDVSEVAIGKLSQAAGQLKVKINLVAIDAAEYEFEPARFDLIVLFYHLDRGLFPKIVSALNPGGLFICKMAVHWGSEIASANDPTSNHWTEMNSCHSFPACRLSITTNDQSVIGEWSNLWEGSKGNGRGSPQATRFRRACPSLPRVSDGGRVANTSEEGRALTRCLTYFKYALRA